MDNNDTKAWMRRRNADVRAKRLASASPSRSPGANSPLDSATAKAIAGSLAEGAGVVVGAAQNTAEGVQLAKNLIDPLYGPLHGGRPAWLPQAQAVDRTIRQAWSTAHHPIQSVKAATSRANVALNPFATPVAPTTTGEIRRRFHIGENQGQVAVHMGMAALGPEGMALRFLPAQAQVARRMAQGMGEREARYLAEPYTGMGSHFIPRRGIAGVKLPKAISDSPLNVLKPSGISRGDMYELHYQVDSKFHGAGLPKHIGKGWSGKKQGLTKNHPLVRVMRGAPTALKQTVSGAAGGVAGVANVAHRGRQP